MRRLCVRFEGISSVENETSDKVFDSVSVFVIDRAYRIGKGYAEKTSEKLCKCIRFSTFRHTTKFYQSRNKLKNIVKIKLDLTNTRYTIFTKTIETPNQSNVADYIMVDINCWLKVVFKNG